MSGTAAGLLTDEHGLTFAYLSGGEAEFLYEEIFTRQAYLKHGVSMPTKGRPVVCDIGANIGLFALHCLRLNPAATVLACEPSPAAWPLLEQNLADHTNAICCNVAVGARSHSSTLHCFADAPGESSRHPRERAMQRRRLRSSLVLAPAFCTRKNKVQAQLSIMGSAASVDLKTASEDDLKKMASELSAEDKVKYASMLSSEGASEDVAKKHRQDS